MTSRSKSKSVPVEETVRYVGFDPVAWIERLIEVNAAAQFEPADRLKIHDGLLAIKKELHR